MLFLATILMTVFLLFMVKSENGFNDFNKLKAERNALIEKNNKLVEENIQLYREIERLKKDLKYIESIARRDFGMIGKDEVVIKMNDKNGASNGHR